MVLTSLVGAARNETNAMPKIAASKPKTMSTAGTHRPGAKMCNEASQGMHHDGSSFAENSWIPKNRNEQGTTKDPEEPAPLEWATRWNFFELQLFYTHQWFLFPN